MKSKESQKILKEYKDALKDGDQDYARIQYAAYQKALKKEAKERKNGN